MEKFIPFKGNIGKGFRNVAIILLFIFFLLWFIHSEAERVHTQLFTVDSDHEKRLKALETRKYHELKIISDKIP